jgi:hypothetical protein
LCIDPGVYGNTLQKFRSSIWYQTIDDDKPIEQRSKGLIPISIFDRLDRHIIQIDENDDSIEWNYIEEVKVPKKTKEEKHQSLLLDLVHKILRDKIKDTTSVYAPTYAASQQPNTFYFRSNGDRPCPSGLKHTHNNNFIVKLDEETQKILYICLSPNCEDNKTHVIGMFNGTREVNEAFFENLGVKNDLDAARRVYHEYPHWVCCNNVLYVFDDSTGMWSDNENTYYSILTKYENYIWYITKNKAGEWVRSNKSYGNDISLMKKCIPLLKTLCVDNEWYKRTCLTSKGKLLFKNGIYDLHNNSWTTTFDPNIVFRNNINIRFRSRF